MYHHIRRRFFNILRACFFVGPQARYRQRSPPVSKIARHVWIEWDHSIGSPSERHDQFMRRKIPSCAWIPQWSPVHIHPDSIIVYGYQPRIIENGTSTSSPKQSYPKVGYQTSALYDIFVLFHCCSPFFHHQRIPRAIHLNIIWCKIYFD